MCGAARGAYGRLRRGRMTRWVGPFAMDPRASALAGQHGARCGQLRPGVDIDENARIPDRYLDDHVSVPIDERAGTCITVQFGHLGGELLRPDHGVTPTTLVDGDRHRPRRPCAHECTVMSGAHERHV